MYMGFQIYHLSGGGGGGVICQITKQQITNKKKQKGKQKRRGLYPYKSDLSRHVVTCTWRG